MDTRTAYTIILPKNNVIVQRNFSFLVQCCVFLCRILTGHVHSLLALSTNISSFFELSSDIFSGRGRGPYQTLTLISVTI